MSRLTGCRRCGMVAGSGRHLACPLAGWLVFACAGCTGGATSQQGEFPPISECFNIGAIAAGDEGTGLDINGDGSIDNGMVAALPIAATALYDAIALSLDEAGIEEYCTEPGQQYCQEEILSVTASIIPQVMTIDAFGDALAAVHEYGHAENWVYFREYIDAFDIGWLWLWDNIDAYTEDFVPSPATWTGISAVCLDRAKYASCMSFTSPISQQERPIIRTWDGRCARHSHSFRTITWSTGKG